MNKIIKPIIHTGLLLVFLLIVWNIKEWYYSNPSIYLWLRAGHLLALFAWFAVLFYLPRLFVYHATDSGDIAIDENGHRRFCVMEHKLYSYIGNPAMVAAVFFGVLLVMLNSAMYFKAPWFHTKMLVVAIIVGYHFYCGVLVRRFAARKNTHSSVFFRFFNEIPTIVLIITIVLVSVVRLTG